MDPNLEGMMEHLRGWQMDQLWVALMDSMWGHQMAQMWAGHWDPLLVLKRAHLMEKWTGLLWAQLMAEH